TSLAVDTPTPPRQINPDIPPQLAALIERLLSKDRERRPATAQAGGGGAGALGREGPPPAGDQGAKAGPPRRPGPAAGAGARVAVVGGVALAGVIVIIRDKQGKEVARFNVPREGKVEIVDDAGKRPAPKEGPRIEPAPLAPLRPGEPLSPTALVRQPAK